MELWCWCYVWCKSWQSLAKFLELKKSLECYCPDKKFSFFVSSKFQISERNQLGKMVVKLEELKLFIESEYIRPENTINMMKLV